MGSAEEITRVVFYRSERGYRNGRTVGLLIVAIAIAGFAGSAVVRDWMGHKSSNPLVLLVACFFAFIVIVAARKFIRGTRELVELSSEGLNFRGTVYGWNSMTQIGKARQSFSKDVWIRVETQSAAGGPRGLVLLQGDKPLTLSEYSAIAQNLKQFTSVHYPFVKIED